MAIYRVQRLYSDEDGGSGMGTFGKVALGAAALGGGLMAGKAGMLGTTVQKGIGTSTAWLGNKVGSQAMINSGAKTVGKAAKTDAINTMGGMGAFKEMSKANRQSFASMANSEKRDAIKGIMDKYKLPAKEAAFSEDTGAALQEAAIYGTLGTGILGAGYLAKKGMLGKTGKKTYESASKKVKAIWNETNGKIKETATESKTVKKPGKPAQATIRTTTKETGKPTETTIKKVKFTPEQWSKVRKVIVEKGLDPRNPAHKLEAAKIAGVRPISVK